MKPVLNKLYKKGEMHKDWLDVLFHHHRRVALPTSFRITEPMFLVPDYARIYFSDFVFYNGEVLTSDEIRAIIGGDKNMRESGARAIHLAEQYYDLGPGSEGMAMELLGFCFILPPTASEKDPLTNANT